MGFMLELQAMERVLMVDSKYLSLVSQVFRPHPKYEWLVLHYLQSTRGLSRIFDTIVFAH